MVRPERPCGFARTNLRRFRRRSFGWGAIVALIAVGGFRAGLQNRINPKEERRERAERVRPAPDPSPARPRHLRFPVQQASAEEQAEAPPEVLARDAELGGEIDLRGVEDAVRGRTQEGEEPGADGAGGEGARHAWLSPIDSGAGGRLLC